MMAVYNCLYHVVILVAVAVSGYKVDEFNLVITPHCGNVITDNSWIEIETDLLIYAEAVCKSGERVAFVSNGSLDFFLPTFYDGQTKGRCVFVKKDVADIYTIAVMLRWDEPGNAIHHLKKNYQVVCAFDKDSNATSNLVVVDPLIAPKEFQSHRGNKSASNVTVRLTNVIGGDLPSDGIHIGRKVLLQARSDGVGSEPGIRPVSCDIVGITFGKRYAILRGGCGDGLVFKKNKGFKTNGLFSVSPPFKMITIEKEDSVKFICNFTLCDFNCDGDSCAVETKRSIRVGPNSTAADTRSINVIMTTINLGEDSSQFIIDLNKQEIPQASSANSECVGCDEGRSKDVVDSQEDDLMEEDDDDDDHDDHDEGLPPAEILPNTNTSKTEYQSPWPKMSFSSYALMVQSAWPLGLAVIMALGMLSTLVVAVMLVCRDRRIQEARQSDGFGEYDSLLK